MISLALIASSWCTNLVTYYTYIVSEMARIVNKIRHEFGHSSLYLHFWVLRVLFHLLDFPSENSFTHLMDIITDFIQFFPFLVTPKLPASDHAKDQAKEGHDDEHRDKGCTPILKQAGCAQHPSHPDNGHRENENAAKRPDG